MPDAAIPSNLPVNQPWPPQSVADSMVAGANDFRTELEHLLNRHCRENGCNTPDFILAQMLVGTLEAFDAAVRRRDEWYGRAPYPSYEAKVTP